MPVLLAFVPPQYPKDPTSYMEMLTIRYSPMSRMATNLLLVGVFASAAVGLLVRIHSAA